MPSDTAYMPPPGRYVEATLIKVTVKARTDVVLPYIRLCPTTQTTGVLSLRYTPQQPRCPYLPTDGTA